MLNYDARGLIPAIIQDEQTNDVLMLGYMNADTLQMTEGAEKLVGTVKRLGYKTAILSGGFQYFGRRLQEALGVKA